MKALVLLACSAALLGAQAPSRYDVQVQLSTRTDSADASHQRQQAASQFTGHYVVTVTQTDATGHNAHIVLNSLTGSQNGTAYRLLSAERLLGLQDAYVDVRVDSSGLNFDGPLLSSSYWAPTVYAVAQQITTLFGNPAPPAVGVTRADTVQRISTPAGGVRENTAGTHAVLTERQAGAAVDVRGTDSTITVRDDPAGALRVVARDTTRYTVVPGQWLRSAVNRTISVMTVRQLPAAQDSVVTQTNDQLTAKRLP